MINYVNHTRIDKRLWDDCISRSLNRRVYAFSWYLDVVCPGWDALIEDDYAGVFPLTFGRKWGISYLYQPYFAQQLGLFSINRITTEMVGCFLRAIPEKFRFVEIQMNDMNHFESPEWYFTRRVNHELEITAGYEALTGGFSQNTRRNIRKSKQVDLLPVTTTSVDQLIGLFRENYGEREGKLKPGHYQILRTLIVYCIDHQKGYIQGVADRNGTLSAAAFFLLDGGHVYFLFAASGKQARENGAMFFLIDHFLAENAGKFGLLDFEGGNDPNLGRFYKGFGAKEVFYPAVCSNRLPKAATRLLYFAGKHRQ